MNPEFYAAEAHEARNRLRAYLPRQLPLELPKLQSRLAPVCMMQFPLVTLTWRHCLELTECRNAFFVVKVAPLRGDFLELLWRLHPWHRDTYGNFTNIPAGHRRPLRFVSSLSFAVLYFYCWRLDIHAAEWRLRRRLREAFQDEPAAPAGKKGEEEIVSVLAPKLNQFDNVSEFLSERGWHAADILGAGVAFTLQIVRAHLIAHGQGARCIAPSAGLASKKPEAKP